MAVNKWEKEVQEAFDGDEKAALEELKKHYQNALDDIDKNIAILQADELTQSKIYRLEHQKALRQQVSAALDKLQSDEYATISAYLNSSYTNGFVGSMYSLHGQGVPMLLPIDQSQAVRAILTDSKLSKPLYEALGVDMAKLKKQISAEISRGIATGSSYNDIARNIASYTKAPLSRATTIVRTEAHRIQQASHYDAAERVKAKGVDIVLQWDASLDGDTRDTHRMLDGTIIEVGEYFESGGNKARYPGDFGDPAEDCNCRCVLTERARSALDEDELKTLQERAEFFELDKSENLEDFRKKYLKAVENLPKSGIINTETEKISRFSPAADIGEAEKFATEVLKIDQATAYNLGLNVDVANGLNEAVFRLGNEFGSLTEAGVLKNVLLDTRKSGAYASYSPRLGAVVLNPVCKQKGAISKMLKDAETEFKYGSWSTGHQFHSIYHELGHAAQHMILDNNPAARAKIDDLYSQVFSDIMGGSQWSLDDNAIIRKGCSGAKAIGLSYYGLRNSSEFVSESIAQCFLSDNPSEIAKKVLQILKGG